jgi:MoxR-like ATPase
MTEQEIRKTLMGYPLKGIKAAAAAQTIPFTDKASACERLATAIALGRCTFADVAFSAGVKGALPTVWGGTAPVAPVVAASGLTSLNDRIDTVIKDSVSAFDRLRDTQQAHVTRLQALETTAAGVAHVLEKEVGVGLKNLSDSLTALDKKADAQAAALRAQISGVKIDELSVAAQVVDAVADAFKPFAAAVAAAGAEAVIGSMVAATVVRRDTCFNVFGVEVKDMKGNDIYVDIWDCPTAPAIDPNFIWTADILRHLLLAQDEGESLWFGGERGTGKTITAQQFAARTGRGFTRINHTKFTSCEDTIGATGLINGETVFEPKGFLLAFTAPSTVILLDEVSHSDPSETAIYNAFLEKGSATTYGGKVWRRAAGVLVFAADNTMSNGDQTGRYAGTRAQNSALADRFSRMIRFEYLPEDQEVEAVVRHTGCTEVLARHVVQAVNICRAKVETGDIIDAPSIRSVCAFIRAVQRMPVADAWASAVAARQPAESAAGLAAVYAATINEALITANL